MYYRFVFFLCPALALVNKKERGFFARREVVEPPQMPATAINSVLQKESLFARFSEAINSVLQNEGSESSPESKKIKSPEKKKKEAEKKEDSEKKESEKKKQKESEKKEESESIHLHDKDKIPEQGKSFRRSS